VRSTPLTNSRFQHSHLKFSSRPQQLVVVVDTGSVELWIDNADFDEGASTTYKPAGGPLKIDYRSDSVTGGIAQDVVGFDTFSVEPQNFLLADTMTTPPLGTNNGNAGVPAPDAKSALGTTAFVPALLAKYPSNEPTISYKFPPPPGSRETRAEHHNEQSGGVLTIGGRNESLFTGDVEFLPLVTFGGLRTHWSLPVLGWYPISSCTWLFLTHAHQSQGSPSVGRTLPCRLVASLPLTLVRHSSAALRTQLQQSMPRSPTPGRWTVTLLAFTDSVCSFFCSPGLFLTPRLLHSLRCHNQDLHLFRWKALAHRAAGDEPRTNQQ